MAAFPASHVWLSESMHPCLMRGLRTNPFEGVQALRITWLMHVVDNPKSQNFHGSEERQFPTNMSFLRHPLQPGRAVAILGSFFVIENIVFQTAKHYCNYPPFCWVYHAFLWPPHSKSRISADDQQVTSSPFAG